MVRARMLVALLLTVPMLAACSASVDPNEDRSTERTEDDSNRSHGGSEGFYLVEIHEVQDDLKMTEQQRVEILALGMEAKKARIDLKKKLSGILTPSQTKRLKEIRLQFGGPSVINSPEMSNSLGLSSEQRAKLKSIQNKISEQVDQVYKDALILPIDQRREKMPEILATISQIRDKSIEQALNILDPDQRARFEKMQGKKLILTKSQAETPTEE